MNKNETTSQKKNCLGSLLICWIIVLATYLLIRMIFLFFGLQPHLTAQGICLVLLPYCFGVLYLRRRCKEQRSWIYALGILLPAVVEKMILYFLGAYLCGVSPLRVAAVMEAVGKVEPYAVLFTRTPMRYVINLLFFNWIYILCGLSFAALCVFGLSVLQGRTEET